MNPIAIIGMAFRFPGDLGDEQVFWQALTQKCDLVTRVPDDRWAVDELEHGRRSEPGRSINFLAGVLSRVDAFDAGFFGISPREAAMLDPQQRLLLELAWEAMENAATPPDALAGTDCAVYVGIASLDYGTRGLDDLASMSAYSMTGNTLSIAANRLSYFFDLRGPSLAVDTACSSSLVALHHACRALREGEASAALVGGVSLLLHPYPFVGFTKASMLSSAGRCKVFDADADGYVRAEGGTVLLLKPLEQAVAAGDPIQAIILATGVNTDGARKTGITIPSREAQAELMRSVLTKAGLRPQDVDYIEAHGTGTAVGDPIEAAAVGAVYGQGRKRPLPIGSIKANLGHMEAASGMAGLIKSILCLKNRSLPPQIHLKTPNPNIDFAGLGLEPVTRYRRLSKKRPLVVGVNSFGFGGANAHVLLREFTPTVGPSDQALPEDLPPLVLSARAEPALLALAERYGALLDGKTPQEAYDIAYGAAFGRARLERRLAVFGATPEEMAQRLARYAQGEMPEGVVREDALPEPGGVAFVYAGNGAQWLGMGRRLMAESQDFAAQLAELDARMQPLTGFSLLAELQAQETSRLDDTTVAQPLLFALQVALTRLLEAQGITPDMVLGHSVGEVAAAWASGALDLDEAIRVIVARSKAQGKTRGPGRMAAVGLSAEAMQVLLTEIGKDLDITIVGSNSPEDITLSGSEAALARIQAHLAPRGVFFRLLDLDYAFHSPAMEPIREDLLVALRGLSAQATGRAVFVSTVTGSTLEGERLGADYWWHNVREPVRFAEAVNTATGLGARIFVEIGPHAILQRYIKKCLTEAKIGGRVLPTLSKEADGWDRLMETVLRCHLLLEKPKLRVFFPGPGRHVHLPNYPWQRERHWHLRTPESLMAIERRRVHPLLGWRIPEGEYVWENVLDPVVLPWLGDHKVGGAIVFPGAAYAEIALAAAREWTAGEALAFEEMDIVLPMVFDGEHARCLRFEIEPRDGSFRIKSRQRLSGDAWQLHAVGRLYRPGQTDGQSLIPAVVTALNTLDRERHYWLAASLGLEYGPSFQCVEHVNVADDRLEATVAAAAMPHASDYLLKPTILDACYQAIIAFFQDELESGRGVALLPVRTGRLTLYRRADVSRLRARLIRRSARSVLAEFELFDTEDRLVARVSGCRFSAAPLRRKQREEIARWRIEARLCPHPAQTRSSDLPAIPELAKAIRSSLAKQSESRRSWFKEALPLLEALVEAFAFEAFQGMSVETLQKLATSDDAYLRWLLGLLRQEGLLLKQEEGWHLAQAEDLPAAEEIWRTLVREHTSTLPQLVMIGRVGRHLRHLILQPEERPGFLTALCRSPLTETLYQDDPAYLGTRLAVQAILQRLADDLPPGRRLRVLEVSVGPSAVPQAVLSRLPEDRLDYLLALPEDFVEAQQAEYSGHPNLVVAAFDAASWAFTATQPAQAHYDIVILHHALHRAVRPKGALEQARMWLVLGGYLVVAERHPDWSAGFVAGLDPAWWHAPANGEAVVSSLLPSSVWLEWLGEEGFEAVQPIFEPAADGLTEGAYLILAQRAAAEIDDLPQPKPAAWQILADATARSFAERLALHLRTQGQEAEVVESLEVGWAKRSVLMQEHEGCAELRPSYEGSGAPDHTVFIRGWRTSPEQASAVLADTLADLKRLVSHPRAPHLWLVTRGGALAEGLPAAVDASPVQAALWGLGRVLMNEHPDLHCTLIDLAGQSPDPALEPLVDELLYPDGLQEIALTEAGRHSLVMCEEVEKTRSPAQEGERYRLDFHMPGQLRNLLWVPLRERPLAEGEVEVRVAATGLNFRDVMYLMGLLPDEAVENGFAGASLGLEFSGVITRVGSRVHDLRPGDRVMGFGSNCFASHVVTRADAVALMPESWTFEAAATVPTVFFTAYYALKHLADLQPGERVLIHGAAGGVGIAAIQLAKHLGAEVFATAGSAEKRDFVRLLGADQVFDSRSLAFADEILAVTNGEGVDVVLNTLAGEAIRRNLLVLRPFGRFLELGKRDFFENTPIGLRPFKDNISYFGIDADQLLTARPRLAARLFHAVMALFWEGALAPLPCRVFPAKRVVDAFRVMQQARHIGKVVVSLADARPPIERPHAQVPPLDLAKSSTWIVTGGLSGFGLQSARWLADRGVGHLVLVGRRGLETPGAQDAIAALAAQGVQVEAIACDLRDAVAVTRLVEYVRTNLPPLQGVLHAATVYDDALLQNLDAERMQTVIDAKLKGAWHLHQATLDMPLEHFVLYSSITTALGNPGQANYVAANAGLEGLADLRRQHGLPATVIAWGPIDDVGYLARNEAVRNSLAQRLGKPPMPSRQALDQLHRALAAGGAHSVANFDWAKLARILPSAKGSRFAVLNRGLRPDGGDAVETGIRSLITDKTPEEAIPIIQRLVTLEVAQILSVTPERIDPKRPLNALGLDSLMAVELALSLEQRFDLRLPTMMLSESPTVHKITERIIAMLYGTEPETVTEPTAESLVHALARQHGEMASAEEMREVAEAAQALARQDSRFTT